jgi:hypothetical protein
MHLFQILAKRRCLAWTAIAIPGLVGAISPAAADPAPVASGMARIWVYRLNDPTEDPRIPLVRLNGASIGAAYQGSSFYRDVLPGNYQISVDGEYIGPPPSIAVSLQPGQVVYADVADNGNDSAAEFAITLAPPDIGAAEVAENSTSGGFFRRRW